MGSDFMLIDTHLHLVNEGYNIEEVIKNAKLVGVDYLIVSGSDLIDNKLNIELLKYDNIFLSVGFHPSSVSEIGEDDFLFLENTIKNNKRVVAVGEIGLDYHYGSDNKDAQIALFRRQLDIALKYDLPVVIHTRDAFLDTYNILKEYDVKGVIHCFSGSLEVAKMFMSLGFYLGIGGVVTFSNSKLKDVVKEIGLDKIVLETDSPYLSPLRGKRNEPCNVRLICDYIAKLLEIDVSQVEKITSCNADRLFDLNVDL